MFTREGLCRENRPTISTLWRLRWVEVAEDASDFSFCFFFSETFDLMLIKVPGSAHLLTQFPFRFSTKIVSLPAGGFTYGQAVVGGGGVTVLTSLLKSRSSSR